MILFDLNLDTPIGYTPQFETMEMKSEHSIKFEMKNAFYHAARGEYNY